MDIIAELEAKADELFALSNGLDLYDETPPSMIPESKGLLWSEGVEAKARFVRTPAGAKRYGVPIGTIIGGHGKHFEHIKVSDPVYKGWDLVTDTRGRKYDVGKENGKWRVYAHNSRGSHLAEGRTQEEALAALNDHAKNSSARNFLNRASNLIRKPKQAPTAARANNAPTGVVKRTPSANEAKPKATTKPKAENGAQKPAEAPSKAKPSNTTAKRSETAQKPAESKPKAVAKPPQVSAAERALKRAEAERERRRQDADTARKREASKAPDGATVFNYANMDEYEKARKRGENQARNLMTAYGDVDAVHQEKVRVLSQTQFETLYSLADELRRKSPNKKIDQYELQRLIDNVYRSGDANPKSAAKIKNAKARSADRAGLERMLSGSEKIDLSKLTPAQKNRYFEIRQKEWVDEHGYSKHGAAYRQAKHS